MANYLEDVDLYYEIVISKGKGYLTKKAEHYFILIAKNLIRRKAKDYKNNEMMDCMQSGILIMFEHWMNFDEKRYKQALPYFTEVCKRGLYAGFNQVHNRKPHQTKSFNKVISIQSSNEGKGLHNIV